MECLLRHTWAYHMIGLLFEAIYLSYRGADKSLARPNSRCRRTESIVSEIHAILIETLGEHAPSYATVKIWVAQFKRGDFSIYLFPWSG
jgi:hypothetical protein